MDSTMKLEQALELALQPELAMAQVLAEVELAPLVATLWSTLKLLQAALLVLCAQNLQTTLQTTIIISSCFFSFNFD
jgi:hypothetical protein